MWCPHNEGMCQNSSPHTRLLPSCHSAAMPADDVVANNVANTERWGVVESVVEINIEMMLQLAKHACSHTAV